MSTASGILIGYLIFAYCLCVRIREQQAAATWATPLADERVYTSEIAFGFGNSSSPDVPDREVRVRMSIYVPARSL